MDELPDLINVIPEPNIRHGFSLRLRYPDREDHIKFRNQHYHYKGFISRKRVARMIGMTEEYLCGVEDAILAAAQWSEMTVDQRYQWRWRQNRQ